MREPTKCPFCGANPTPIPGLPMAWECHSYGFGDEMSSVYRSTLCFTTDRTALLARIARLEAAGDKLLYYCKYATPREEWRKAKL